MPKNKYTVMIADYTNKNLNKIVDVLKKSEMFETVTVITEGRDIIESVKDKRPDLLITELVFPMKDGIELLEDLKNENLKRGPAIIVTSALSSDKVIRKCMSLNVSYFLEKPYSIDTLLKVAKGVLEEKKETEMFKLYAEKDDNNSYIKNSIDEIIETKVTNIIHKIGVPAHIKGYKYLRSAIIKSIVNEDIINSVTKELYPEIAKDFETTPPRVERAIRHAIEVAWNRGEEETLQKIFGYTISSNKGKPTNSEFIAMIADRLRLQNQSIL